jgi:hypothetical protein
MFKKVASYFLLALFLLQLSGCGSFNLVSAWKDKDIKIDGDDSEWSDKMVQCGSLFVGALNDGDYLYLCVTTSDKKVKSQLMGMMGQTYTLWFDPLGKTNKSFGLKFSNAAPAQRKDNKQPGEKPADGVKPEEMAKPSSTSTQMFEQMAGDMKKNLKIEIIEDGEVVGQLADATGVEAVFAVTGHGRKLIYEFKIPLKTGGTAKYAIDTAPGKQIAMGIEASEIKTPGTGQGQGVQGQGGAPPSGGGMSQGGGAPPMGGGQGGPGGSGGPGTGTTTTPEPLNMISRLTLAVKS